MKKVFRLSAVILLVMALLVPMFAVSASAATKWNGTSVLKSGKSYVITSSVTMDSKMTIPAKTTLTISKGGSLTISKGVTATVNGTLSVAKGGTLKVYGTLNADENSTVKISGKFTYGASAKLKLNGTYSVTSTGTVTGSGTAEINLSAKSQYNSDMDKINTYLEKKNYSKACSLFEHAIGTYSDKKTTLQKAYSSAVIDWADQYADNGDYTRACSVLNSAKAYLSDTTDVTNRYDFYQGYIPIRAYDLGVFKGREWLSKVVVDTSGNKFYDARIDEHFSSMYYYDSPTFKLDGKYTNFKATLSHLSYNIDHEYYHGDGHAWIEMYGGDDLSNLTRFYVSPVVYMGNDPLEIDVDVTGFKYVVINFHGDDRGNTMYDGVLVDSATFYKQ